MNARQAATGNVTRRQDDATTPYPRPNLFTMSLPRTPDVTDSAALDHALSILLEPSPALHDLLVPRLANSESSASTYADLIDRCADEVAKWSAQDKAVFLGGHPLIGEVKNLSALSANEQGGGGRTPKVVLDR